MVEFQRAWTIPIRRPEPSWCWGEGPLSDIVARLKAEFGLMGWWRDCISSEIGVKLSRSSYLAKRNTDGVGGSSAILSLPEGRGAHSGVSRSRHRGTGRLECRD